MGNAILHAVMNGVENTTDLGVTQQEFNAMSVEEQQQLIAEYLADVVDLFVKEDESSYGK